MYNLINKLSAEQNYQNGLLPQRNSQNYWYSDSSCRSNLSKFKLSSENRRIIAKTIDFKYQLIPLKKFIYNYQVQKTIYQWIKKLGWDYPMSSIKIVFTSHIFNYVYIWQDNQNNIIAYSLCYFSKILSHIAYVFYDPKLSHKNLPIRLTLQAIIDSQQKKLGYCYLGRFNLKNKLGYYKRELPGFEYYSNNNWIQYIP